METIPLAMVTLPPLAVMVTGVEEPLVPPGLLPSTGPAANSRAQRRSVFEIFMVSSVIWFNAANKAARRFMDRQGEYTGKNALVKRQRTARSTLKKTTANGYAAFGLRPNLSSRRLDATT
jgi:hypothetical protein